MPSDRDVLEVDLELHPDALLDPVRLTEAAARKARVRPDQVHRTSIPRRAIDARRGRVRIHARVRLELSEAATKPTPRASAARLAHL